jgi:hypothetical protein
LLLCCEGKQPLFLNIDLPPDVYIFKGRLDLEHTISAVIYSIVHDEDLPKYVFTKNSIVTKATPERVRLLLERALSIYSIDQLFDYSASLTPSQHQGSGLSGADASFRGVASMMENLLDSDFYLFRSKIYTMLDLVDTYGSSMLTRDMFEDFMQLMMKTHLSDDSTASTCKMNDEEHGAAVITHENYGIDAILQGGGKYSAEKWKMLYCVLWGVQCSISAAQGVQAQILYWTLS